MLTILATTGRVLLPHWPALLAWFLGGTLVHYLGIQLAGYVGAWTSTGGFLLLPLAILARLISFVAMFLVVRDGLRNLQAIAPLPDERAARRRTFVQTLLASILPFFAIYAAWGFLREDVNAYTSRALAVNWGVSLQELAARVEGGDLSSGGEQTAREIGSALSFNVVTVSIIVLAFAGRWAWKRYAARVPKSLSLVAVYFEAVWVCFSLFLLSDGIRAVTGWIDDRVAMVWLRDLRDGVGAQLVPLAWVWDGVEWLLGEAGGVLLQPLAWLMVAGVVYGQAIVVEQVRVEHRLVKKAGDRLSRLPGPVEKWVREVVDDVVGRFRPVGRAVVLMWRAGPVMIATYVLLYTIVIAADTWLGIAVTRAVGPNDLYTFWQVADALIFLLVPLILEPIRIVLVAGSYDATLGALPRQGSIENRTNSGAVPTGETSTQKGPAPSGTM